MANRLKVIFVLVLLSGLTNAIAATPFGMVELRSERLNAFPQWQRVMGEHSEFIHRMQSCEQGLKTDCDKDWLDQWYEINQLSSSADKLETLNQVNTFFNEWMYIDDQTNWGRSDWWTAPRVFMERSGDCEDYAISKYYALKQLGFSIDDLRVLVVKDVYRDIAHAVLMVRLNGEYRILDSLSQSVLNPADVGQYRPVYSLNERYRWLHYQPITAGAGS